ncbi:MAG: arginine--tRNA ligase, partial [Patescibacteria group bacterium]|nr:arginine--tRNA ligase [Patescibacteria group bacterium]
MNYKEELIKILSPITGLFDKDIITIIEKPKDESFGDFAFPCFILSKEKKLSPDAIAQDIHNQFSSELFSTTVAGPYLNIKIIDPLFIPNKILDIINSSKLIKQSQNNKTVLVESPSPNTNKPLHLGHLRNILLGQSLVSLLKAIGSNAKIVNVINDRGVHICKSMLAYKLWGEGSTPESSGMKSDHFVGKWYVRFAEESSKSEKAKKELESQAQDMLILWEKQDSEVMALWDKMNEWAYIGWDETFKKLNFKIDKNYYESKTYQGGKDIILSALDEGLFEKSEDGAVIVDLSSKNLDKKVLLRSNGTSVYITQDINLAKIRYTDFKFDELIYVVGNEQEYHFKVLFEIFNILNFSFADSCSHFSYGMIELPEGKMKSREGNVIDTDDLLEQTISMAKEAVNERYSDIDNLELEKRSELIALGAIRFFFLKHDSLKNFVFDPKESLSFEGETGPYIQYTYARISSILRKSETDYKNADLSLLKTLEDKSLTKLL